MNSFLIRLIDICAAAVGLIIGTPLLLLLCLIGFFDTGWPIYRQIRLGRNQTPFVMWKFRTMRRGTDSLPTHLVDPSAITPIGKILRKTKLDEVPQLWNVLKGEMSLVGPRPCLPNQTELIQEREERGVFAVRPGVTGLGQVRNVDMSKPVELAELDQEMIDNFRLIDYFKLILMTAMGGGRGDAVKESHRRVYLSSPHMSGYEMPMIREAFLTNWIGPVGPHLSAFEQEIAHLTGTRYAVAVSSGTAALHLILRALGIGPGDLVLCSDFTFVASVTPIRFQGAEPVFIDSETISWNLDPELLEECIDDLKKKQQKPKALILVHLYGQSANIEPIKSICERENILLIEDAAEALGATYQGKAPGSFGKAGFISFNGNKIITTSGGGMVITDDEELARQVRFLAFQARDPGLSYEHSVVGYNYTMSNVLAGIGRGQLKVLPKRVTQRRTIFNYYAEALHDLPGITLMPEAPWGICTRWLSCVLFDPDQGAPERNQVIELLEQHNIESRPLWKPMHQQKVFAGVPFYGRGVSDHLYAKGLCLPSSTHLTKEDQKRIIRLIRGISPGS